MKCKPASLQRYRKLWSCKFTVSSKLGLDSFSLWSEISQLNATGLQSEYCRKIIIPRYMKYLQLSMNHE